MISSGAADIHSVSAGRHRWHALQPPDVQRQTLNNGTQSFHAAR